MNYLKHYLAQKNFEAALDQIEAKYGLGELRTVDNPKTGALEIQFDIENLKNPKYMNKVGKKLAHALSVYKYEYNQAKKSSPDSLLN